MTDELDVAKAQANAVEAAAKAAGSGIDGAREAGRFMGPLLKAPLQVVSEIVTERLRVWHFELQLKWMDKVRAAMAAVRMTRPTRQLPLNIGIPLIEAGFLQEHETMQEKFAWLLVNAVDASAGPEVPRTFVSILENLSPLEAQILDRMYEAIEHLPSPNEPQYHPADHSGMIDTSELPRRALLADPSEAGGRREPERAIQVALWNLQRLGCFEPEPMTLGASMMARGWLTPLGVEFIRACRPRTSGAPAKG